MFCGSDKVTHVFVVVHDVYTDVKLSVLICHIYQLIHIHVSTDQLRNSVTAHVFNIFPLTGNNSCGVVGAVVSYSIVSIVFTILPIFHTESRKLIYTLLVHSPVDNCQDLVVAHQVRFVGDGLFPYATSTTPTHTSVGHEILSITHVVFVHVALLFITKLHHTGHIVSIFSVLPVV